MIEKPEQPESLTMTRRDWVRVAAALAIRTYTDPRLQELATVFGRQVATWEPDYEPTEPAKANGGQVPDFARMPDSEERARVRAALSTQPSEPETS